MDLNAIAGFTCSGLEPPCSEDNRSISVGFTGSWRWHCNGMLQGLVLILSNPTANASFDFIRNRVGPPVFLFKKPVSWASALTNAVQQLGNKSQTEPPGICGVSPVHCRVCCGESRLAPEPPPCMQAAEQITETHLRHRREGGKQRDLDSFSLGYSCNGRSRNKGVCLGGKYLPDQNNSSVRCHELWMGRERSTVSVKAIASFLGMRHLELMLPTP